MAKLVFIRYPVQLMENEIPNAAYIFASVVFAFCDSKQRAIHDLLVRTRVIKLD